MRDPVGEFGAAMAAPEGGAYALDDAAFQSTVRALIDHARDRMDIDYLPGARQAWRYYHMEVDADPMGLEMTDEAGNKVREGSRVVESRVRDAINAVLPECYRVFLGSQEVVEFEPRFQEDVEGAKQATDVIAARFWRGEGARFTYDALLDWFIKFNAIRVWAEPVIRDEWHDFDGIDQQALELLQSDEEIVELEADPVEVPIVIPALPGPQGEQEPPLQVATMVTFTGRLRRQVVERHEHKFALVPQEELLLDADARNMDQARIVGTDSLRTVSELVGLGLEYETVRGHAEAHSWTRETSGNTRWDRSGGVNTVDGGLASADMSTRLVRTVDCHVRVDRNGDGLAEVYHVIAIGAEHKIVFAEEEDWPDFIVSSPFPIPHQMIGEGLAELMIDRQDIATALIRRFLDNLAQAVRPRSIGLPDTMQDLEALDSLFPGHINADPSKFAWWQVPFVGQYALGALEYFQGSDILRSGVSPAGQGLDPDVLKGQTVAGAKSIVAGPQSRVEFYARMFAETVMAPLFRALLKLHVRYPNPGEIVRLRNEFISVDPRTWRTDYDASVKVGLGTGSRDEKMVGLQLIKATQEQLLQINNPLVSPEKYWNLLSDFANLTGCKEPGRYFVEPTPELVQQAEQAQEQGKQKQMQEQAAMAAQLEQAKAQAKAAADAELAMVKGQIEQRMQSAELAAKQREIAMEAEFKRQLAVLQGQIEIGLQAVKAPSGQGDIPSPVN